MTRVMLLALVLLLGLLPTSIGVDVTQQGLHNRALLQQGGASSPVSGGTNLPTPPGGTNNFEPGTPSGTPTGSGSPVSAPGSAPNSTSNEPGVGNTITNNSTSSNNNNNSNSNSNSGSSPTSTTGSAGMVTFSILGLLTPLTAAILALVM